MKNSGHVPALYRPPHCITVLVLSTAHERKTVMYFTAVQQFSSYFGVLKRTSDHKRYYPSQPNTRRERRPSSNKHLSRMHEFSTTALPEQTRPASRARKAINETKRVQSHVIYYCSYSSTRVHFKFSITQCSS